MPKTTVSCWSQQGKRPTCVKIIPAFVIQHEACMLTLEPLGHFI